LGYQKDWERSNSYTDTEAELMHVFPTDYAAEILKRVIFLSNRMSQNGTGRGGQNGAPTGFT